MSCRVFILSSGLLLTVLFSTVFASNPSGKLVDTQSGQSSAVTVLTNGAHFKIGTSTYQLDMDQTDNVRLMEELNKTGAPLQINELPAKDAFNMLTHLSGIPIVCSRLVEKEVEISINTQDASMMEVIEQVAFQIDAEAILKDKTIWVTPKK